MKKKVKRTNICTRKVEKFNSISEAGKDIDARNPLPNIHSALNGRLITAYGYKWEYIK